MDTASTQSSSLYLEILFLFLAFVLVCVLYFLLRIILTKLSISGRKPTAIFLSRLNLPSVLIVVTLCLKLPFVQSILFPSQQISPFFDAALAFFAVFFLIRFIDAMFRTWFVKRGQPIPLPDVLHNLMLAVIYLIVFFIIMRGIFGFNITPVLATSALLTMILGLAFQDVLSNILSGMSLHLTKSFGKGDWISVAESEGIVINTNWRETRIFDRFSNIIVIPNNIVASEKITNFSYPNKKTALVIPVKASYEAPPSEVFAALKEAAADVPDVLSEPEPEPHLLGYGDFGIDYAIKFWITDFRRKFPIMAAVGRNIWYKFKRRNIEIPLPLSDKLSDVMRSVDRTERAVSDDREMERTARDLVRSDFLRYQDGDKKGQLIVSEKEFGVLASSIHRHRFAEGETVFKQGEKGTSCYVVARGLIRGEIVYKEESEQGESKEYRSEFKVEQGGIFGEMSLFTGMPRTATCVVVENAELLEINQENFARLLERNPDMGEVIADLASQRNKENQELLKKIKELSATDIEEISNKNSILARLKNLVKRLT
ncbi:MAG: mechanosensitive ion channel family protein [Candidatus Aminicenantes bacterium]|jgi:small-conductance mechanosensitive channel